MLYRLLLSAQYKKDQEILNVGFNQMFGLSCTERVDHCNSLLCGLSRNNINKLQRVQNMAARLITNTPRFSNHTCTVSIALVPISVRIKFKVILITFKAIHGLVPYYIQNLKEVKKKSSYNLRSNDELLLAPRTFKS